MSIDDPLKWFRHVPRLQRILNSTKSRSTNYTPFELMIGVPMTRPEDLELSKILEEEMLKKFQEERSEMRTQAKIQIQKVQEENRIYYNRNRKKAMEYKLGDLVAMRRSQFGSGLKLHPKFLGPYEVIKVKPKDRYDLKKVGFHEGPNITSSSADNMKMWRQSNHSDTSSESDEEQDGRM